MVTAAPSPTLAAPGSAPTGSPSPSAEPSATPETPALPSPTPTSASSGAEAGSPAPVLALAVSYIEPAAVENTTPAALRVVGQGFRDGMQVAIGGVSLEEVQVVSATEVRGTLPPGLCPGLYGALVTGSAGEQASGGALTVRGVRTAVLGEAAPDRPATLSAWDQVLTVPLPEVLVEDTTCGTTDWQLSFELGPLSLGDGGDRLWPRSLELTGDDLPGPQAAELVIDGEVAHITVAVPRPVGRGRVTLHPSIEVVLPAYARAGRYTATLAISLQEEP